MTSLEKWKLTIENRNTDKISREDIWQLSESMPSAAGILAQAFGGTILELLVAADTNKLRLGSIDFAVLESHDRELAAIRQRIESLL